MKEIKQIGTTSFILHDTRVKNVHYLKGAVDIVQLLYLESFSDPINQDDLDEIDELIKIKDNLEYLIHMPIDLKLSNDQDWEKLEHFTSILSKLNMEYIIIHPEDDRLFFEKLPIFLDKYPFTLIENTDTIDFFDTICNTGGNICLDIGHALLSGVDIINFLKRFQTNIKAFHLHGVHDEKDHKSVRYIEDTLLKYLLDFAFETDVKIVIEVFGEKDFNDSKEYLRRFFKQNGYSYHRWD